jgi:bilirubin oxidase
MSFLVRPLTGPDTSVPPDRLSLPAPAPLGPPDRTRRLALLERNSAVLPGAGPVVALLGVVDPRPGARMWADPVSENPATGATEIWEFHNNTPDAHPIHVHEVQFEVIDRGPFRGPAQPPQPWERGSKDTVIANPRQVTRIKALFDRPGSYVWHCHVLEHEDNEMMRPYRIGP